MATQWRPGPSTFQEILVLRAGFRCATHQDLYTYHKRNTDIKVRTGSLKYAAELLHLVLKLRQLVVNYLPEPQKVELCREVAAHSEDPPDRLVPRFREFLDAQFCQVELESRPVVLSRRWPVRTTKKMQQSGSARIAALVSPPPG